MILRPVTPASAVGPPISNAPVGFTRYSIFRCVQSPSTCGASWSATQDRISFGFVPCACWVETSTDSTSTGRPSR